LNFVIIGLNSASRCACLSFTFVLLKKQEQIWKTTKKFGL